MTATPSQRAEAATDAALDQLIDAVDAGDDEAIEQASSRALQAAWLYRQREWQALEGLDPTDAA